jgi:hypothetical protein
MAPDPALLSWFVDESLMGVGKALSWARKDTIHAGHVLIPGAPTGALDVQWMPVVAAAGLVVIGRDATEDRGAELSAEGLGRADVRVRRVALASQRHCGW